MIQKKANRAQILGLREEGRIEQKDAARRLRVTPRQVRRIVTLYRAEGMPGLVSKNQGRASNRRLGKAVRATAVEVIGQNHRDFGPTLATDKLSERHGVNLSIESTRQLMIGAGYWQPKKDARVCVHPMRVRRAWLGELIQIDGSPARLVRGAWRTLQAAGVY